MGWQASHRFARIAPRKARLVAEMIRGMPVDDALAALRFSGKRAGVFIRKTVLAAVNSAQQDEAPRDELIVNRCWVDEGPVLKRWRPKDRGRAHPIMKRTSHIRVEVERES